MAFALNPNEEQQQNQPGTPGMAGQPVSSAAAPGAGPSGGKTPTGVAGSKSPAQPFTNLQSYLTANAPQIQQQADTISGNLENQYGQIKGNVDQGVQAFNQQVQGGFTPENQQVVQSAAANPAQFVQTPGNTEAFKSQINDQYTGPSNFEGTSGYAPLNAQVTKGAANANLLNTPAGVQTYLQGSENNATPGENLLDSVLLQQSPGAIQQVQKAASPFSQLPQYLSNAVTSSDQAASAAPVAAQKAASNAAAAINPVAQGFQKTLAAATPAAQAQENAYNATIAKNQQELNPFNSQLTNFNAGTGIALDNPLTAYLNEKMMTNPASLSNVATNPQYAEDAALAQLMGIGYTPSLNQADIGQSGTFNIPSGQGAANTSDLAQKFSDQILAGNKALSPNSIFGKPETPIGDKSYNEFLTYLQSLNPNSVSANTSPLLKNIYPLIPT